MNYKYKFGDIKKRIHLILPAERLDDIGRLTNRRNKKTRIENKLHKKQTHAIHMK